MLKENSAVSGDALDRAEIGRFHHKLLALAFLAMVVDGYDLTVAGFAAPSLVQAWQIDAPVIGIILSMSLAGVFAGSFLFGRIGDSLGRKPALIAANVLLGVSTLAAAFSDGPVMLAILRAIAGIGIGGVIPNLVALVSEFAPLRFRSREVMRMLLGNSIGAAGPGLVAILFLESWGWEAFFWVGGLTPLLIALACWRWMPESVRFLLAKRPDDPRIDSTLGELGVARAGLSCGGAETARSAGFGQLFDGTLRLLTPLLWVAFVADLMTYYFLYGWSPLLLGLLGVAPDRAAASMMAFAVGGAASGIALGPVLDRSGGRIFPVMFVLAIAFVAPLGFIGTTGLLLPIAFVAGFLLIGLQYGLNAFAGALYPTICRSQGVGAALGIGRIGAVVGSLGGGYLVAAGIEVSWIYSFVIVPLILAAIAIGLVVNIHNKSN